MLISGSLRSTKSSSHVMVVMIGGVSQENSRNLFEACSQCLSHFVERYTTPLFRENVSTEDEDCIRKVDEAGLVVTKAFQEKYERGALNDTEKRSLLGVMFDFGLSVSEINATMINAIFAACEPGACPGKDAQALSKI